MVGADAIASIKQSLGKEVVYTAVPPFIRGKPARTLKEEYKTWLRKKPQEVYHDAAIIDEVAKYEDIPAVAEDLMEVDSQEGTEDKQEATYKTSAKVVPSLVAGTRSSKV